MGIAGTAVGLFAKGVFAFVGTVLAVAFQAFRLLELGFKAITRS